MTPVVKPLAKWQRKLFFLALLSAFLISLPIFIFYATGYRYDFFAEKPVITATGGLYISADAKESFIYVNEEPVNNVRVFRQASYIQGLIPGMQRVHVQSSGLHTWVKILPVFPHIVTEAEAFNLPVLPHIRPITEFSTTKGEGVVFASTTAKVVFDKATSTVSTVFATTSATSSYLANSEFSVLKLLFAEQEELIEAKNEIEEEKFSFSTTTATSSDLENATTTKNRDNLSLYQKDEDIYVGIIDENAKVPYYFCLVEELPEYLKTEDIDLQKKDLLTESDLIKNEETNVSGKCRKEIRIDRKYQEVKDFYFFPQNPNLVLMHLSDGIHVVEIDDRSWQNTQMLYPGNDLQVLIYGGSIFVKEKDFMFEVLTEIPTE
jgi:hypothetical protein